MNLYEYENGLRVTCIQNPRARREKRANSTETRVDRGAPDASMPARAGCRYR